MSGRNYGIDLLRLVLMFMVCMCHILGQGGALYAADPGSVEHGAFWFLGVCACCAVDGFAMISGYIASDRPQKWDRLVSMWFQAFFYSFVLSAILRLSNVGPGMGIRAWIGLLMPVTFNTFWYFTAYFALFFAMPALNMFVGSLDVSAARKAVVILIVLFSAIGLFADPFNTKDGYSAIWLMVLYCLGALARRAELFSEKKSSVLILLFAALSLLSWGVVVAFGSERLVSYVSPTILLNSLILVVLFSRLKVRGGFIGKLSPLVFGVYLFQMNPIIWKHILKDSTAFLAGKPVAVGVGGVVGLSLLLFAAGLIVEYVRARIAEGLKIPALSRRIVAAAQKALNGAASVLK